MNSPSEFAGKGWALLQLCRIIQNFVDYYKNDRIFHKYSLLINVMYMLTCGISLEMSRTH